MFNNIVLFVSIYALIKVFIFNFYFKIAINSVRGKENSLSLMDNYLDYTFIYYIYLIINPFKWTYKQYFKELIIELENKNE